MRPDTLDDYRERILRVLIHIQGHLDEALDLEHLASIAHFSPYHFHRVFSGMVGESVMEHIRRLRLERAALRLKFSDEPVTRLAFEAGYETHEAFTRAFRTMFGETPSGFRQIHRSVPYPKVPSDVHFSPDGRVDHFTVADAGGLVMEARVERIQPFSVAFARHVGPYGEVGVAWGKLCAWAGPRGLLRPDTAFIGLCHDDPEVTPPDKVRYDACIRLDQEVQPEGEIGIQTVVGGEYAVTTHHGPYDRLGQTYAKLCGQWLPEHGYEPRSAPSFEIYRNNPDMTPAEDLLTDVHVPVEAR
jgi:AraC family transcriptional regulator